MPPSDPVPAILEYLPYRRRDGTVLRDRQMHAYFAGHGYAAVRVDMRGSGDSDGMLLDEYLPQEQADAVEVIAWLAAQPWCSGTVGMMGISWGGFNALQVASHRPPALKAIITACSTDDRYADDCHYMGGCLLNNTIAWASTMFAFGAQPPDPDVVGERWRDMWLERLENNPLMARGLDRASAPRRLLEAGLGLRGLFSPSPPRSMRSAAGRTATPTPSRACWPGCPARSKGLIGPWAHAYPHAAQPGPQIGFLQEALRWWDHLAEGHRHRHHGRADAARLDAGKRAAGDDLRGAAGPLGRRERLAAGRTDGRYAFTWCRRPRWRAPAPEATVHHRLQPGDRRHLRRMVPLWPGRRTAGRPAARRWPLGLFRHRAA